MASISASLLGAGAEAKHDWARASALTAVTFTGEARLVRGIAIEIGVDALATADAGLSRFVDATVQGNAFAQAKAGLQYQLPLNLFDKFGVTIGAHAAAQAAAGIEVGLGLSVGDFVNLIVQSGDSGGVPLEIVLLLLDEATIGGKFEVHVAAAAMAYAEILITGEVVKNPGFHVVVDAGLGLAAGVGFSGSLDLGIRDFRRFYGRAVDRAVGSLVDSIGLLIRDDPAVIMPTVKALAPVATMVFRVAYEIGDFLNKTPNVGQGQQDAANLANHCVGIFLEEGQRFLFGRFVEAGLCSVERLVVQGVPGLAQGVWDGLMPKRQALATALRAMPAEPFQPTDANAVYWSNLIERTIALVSDLPAANQPDVIRGMAILYAASELSTEAFRERVNRAQAYAFVIGGGSVATSQPRFRGSLSTPLNDGTVAPHIRQVLGRPASHVLGYPDLLAYLIKDTTVSALRGAVPDVDEYLKVFEDPRVANSVAGVLAVILDNRDAFVPNPAGNRDPQATLRVLLELLDSFITDRINEEVLPVLNAQIADGNAKLFFNEVVLGTLSYTKDVIFQTILDWDTSQQPPDRAAFTEALSAVMTMLLGRSLVLIGEGFMTAMQGDMVRACRHAANTLEARKNPFTEMGIQPDPALTRLFADTLRIGGEIFGPLPEGTRRNLRFALYDVMEALPPGDAARADFVSNLTDQFFIPNEQSLEELSHELLAISSARFQLFVERVLESGVEFALARVDEFIDDVIATILGWVRSLEEVLDSLRRELAELDRAIQRLLLEAEQAFQEAVDCVEALLERLSSSTLRGRLRADIADEVYRGAKSELRRMALYQGLPREAKPVVKAVLKDVIRNIIEGPVLDPIFDALAVVATELDGVLDDVRDLNPRQPLRPQLLDLVIDRLEDGIRDVFGGTRPRIDVGFTVNVGVELRFSIGRVELPFSSLFSVLRDAVDDLDFYESELQAATTAVADAFRKWVNLEDLQQTLDAKSADQTRLAQIRTDFASTPKSVTIVNPVQSLVYDDDLRVQVHLGGVPASYLGLNADEQQRVFILLNGQLIPPIALAVDEPFIELETVGPPAAIDRSRLPALSRAPTGILGKVASIQLHHAPASQPAIAPDSSKRLPPLRSSLRSTGRGRVARTSRPSPTQRIHTGRDGSRAMNGALRNVLPGRRMTPTKRDILTSALPPGISLEFDVPRHRLTVGTNTLAVVVVDPEDVRYQHVVSFGVVDTTEAAANVPRLPPVGVRASGGRPMAPRRGIDPHFDRTAMTARLNDGRVFVIRQSAEHLKQFKSLHGPATRGLA